MRSEGLNIWGQKFHLKSCVKVLLEKKQKVTWNSRKFNSIIELQWLRAKSSNQEINDFMVKSCIPCNHDIIQVSKKKLGKTKCFPQSFQNSIRKNKFFHKRSWKKMQSQFYFSWKNCFCTREMWGCIWQHLFYNFFVNKILKKFFIQLKSEI